MVVGASSALPPPSLVPYSNLPLFDMLTQSCSSCHVLVTNCAIDLVVSTVVVLHLVAEIPSSTDAMLRESLTIPDYVEYGTSFP